MKYWVLLLVLAVVLVIPTIAHADYVWHDRSDGLTDLHLESVAQEGDLVIAGSSRFIFRSEDGGRTWKRTLSVYGANGGTVNQIVFSPRNKSHLYAATEAGLFYSADCGLSWKKIYEEDVGSVAVSYLNPNHLFLTGDSGVFISENQGRTWQASSEGLTGAGFNCLKIDPLKPEQLYLSGPGGIFFSNNKGSTWERIYSQGAGKSSDETQPNDDADEAAGPAISINDVVFDPELKGILYFATSRGVLSFSGENREFKWLASAGLGSSTLTSLIITKRPETKIIAAGSDGVFAYNETDQVWSELYKGLMLSEVNGLTSADASARVLWAAGEGGIFRAGLTAGVDFANLPGNMDLETLFAGDPSIREVQEIAIRYAEVEPEKIKAWRRGAARRWFLPELSADYDKTVNYDSGSDRYYTGPYDWGVNLKWDLADLIWNSSQTSIDVRSRLMVQLRDDILDEVNRLYFERHRVMLGLVLDPPTDKEKLLDMKLRLEELTAGLDAMTGGWFSRAIKLSQYAN